MAIYAGKHYYKRSGDSFYQCEHYDILDIYSRKKSPILILMAKVNPRQSQGKFKHRYEIIISIKNEGKSIAKFPYLAINCSPDYRADEYGLDGNRNCGLQRVRNNILFKFNYSGGNHTVIYPETILDVDRFVTEVNQPAVPQDLKIEYMMSAESMENVKGEIVIDTRRILIESVY